jgi:molybdopterin biosynthesis enzyme
MVAVLDSPQRIARLTPVADLFATVDRLVAPVAPSRLDIAAAGGRTLAADLTVAEARPPTAIALRDGWALTSEETSDAGSYAPAILTRFPVRLDVGDALPAGADAVAALDAVRERSGKWEALAAVAPDEGVLAHGIDAAPGEALRRAGQVLRRSDLPALRALGVGTVSVRQPRIRLAAVRADAILEAAVGCLAGMVEADGGVANVFASAADLDAALTRAGADLIIIVGGTGTGARDRSVEALTRAGQVECHGIALAPGETTAFGRVGQTPVLLVPGRLDAALAAWLIVGRRIMARLTSRTDGDPALPCRLSRKLVSGLGISELALLRRDGDGGGDGGGDGVLPLASVYLPLSALLEADGYVLVPPDSEGYPAGARIEMRLLP